MLHRVVFFALAALTLTPWVSAPLALVAGAVFALIAGNPFPKQTARAQAWLLQGSVVGLGAAMNLEVILSVGASGVLQTALTLGLTLTLAWGLSRAFRVEPVSALLIGVGTAICGGSAIAAVAPVIGARPQQTSVALAVVFVLNAVALVLFPALGQLFALSPAAFGLWSALAIHDTSSVVGASLQFGGEALAVGTTVKLTRALWIIPLTLVLARVWPRSEATGQGTKRPWFILGFLAVAALVTWVPALQAPGRVVAAVSRQVLVLTLFLVGAGVSREAVRALGVRPLVLGVSLWLVVASASLAAVKLGWLVPPL
ncbi:MAG: putative sulfate exporter family transporter [Archangium sp.]|nr:putative sulfate exporter family transporter [Archangium sp.]MDP3158276.1 putative sulfate exporter family transporter [Archangium sp.]MDP3569838.1 putative sulfate exporter family transporter [Archangium sp.]